MQAQALTVGLQQSTMLHSRSSFQYSRGIAATYDAAEKPWVWSLSINRVATVPYLSYHRSWVLPESHTDTTLGLADSRRSFKEFDIRLGTFYKTSFGALDFLAGAEVLLGRTNSQYEYYESLYIKNGEGGYLSRDIAISWPPSSGPSETEGERIEVNYLKYGIAPKVGARYALAEHLTLTALLGVDLGKRVNTSNVDSEYDINVLEEIDIRRRAQLSVGVGYRF